MPPMSDSPAGSRSVQAARRQAGGRRLGARPRYSVGGAAGYVTASLAMDDLIAGTGVAYRALTNPSFMDNIAMRSGDQEPGTVLLADRRRPQAADRRHPRHRRRGVRACCWTTAGAALAKSRCSALKICLQRHGRDHLRGSGQRRALPADHLRGLQGQVRRLRHVRSDGSGDDRHGLGEERRPGQRRSAHAGNPRRPVFASGAKRCSSPAPSIGQR